MKFSAATLLVAASLGLAAPAPQQDASNSDFIYQLQASAQNNNFNQQLFTDGSNIYYGPQTQNVAANGQPLVAINVYMDNNGALQSTDNQNRFVSVGENNRMQMTDRQRGRWNMRNNRNNNNDVSLRFNDEQRFLACPVQNSGRDNNGQWNSGRSRSDSRSRAANRQDWNNRGNQQDDQVYQVYVNNAPCDNPVELSLNGQKRGRRNNRQNRNGRNRDRKQAREFSDENIEATIVLRVNGVTRQNAMYSPVFNQDGRMYTQMQRDNHDFSNLNGNNQFRLSQEGQIIDTRSQQYAQLGQNQQLSMTIDQNQGLLFTVDDSGSLQYNDKQFLACDAGNNGLYEVRPAGAGGAAAACANARAIVIQIEQQ